MKKVFSIYLIALMTTSGLFAQSSITVCNYALATMQEMITDSKGIVKARVTAVETYWNEEHTRCYSLYQLRVINTLKGKLPATIVLVTEVAGPDTEARCSNIIGLHVGKEIIACLDRIPADWECGYTPRHAYAPYGSVQGIFVLNEKDGVVTHAFQRYQSTDELYSEIAEFLMP